MSSHEPDYSDPGVAAAALTDPSTGAGALYQITQLRPELRPMVAAHPALYPGLRQWLADLHDPAVDAALAGSADVDEDTSTSSMPTETVMMAPATGQYSSDAAASQTVAWSQYGQPMAGVPHGYRPRRDRKKVIIAAVLAAALGLGGATALATTQHWFGGGNRGGGGSSGLTVTGDAPNASAPRPSFADGYQTIYQQAYPESLIAATAEVVVMDNSDGLWSNTFGINRATGSTVWSLYQRCAGPVANNFIVCQGVDDATDEPANSLQWVDINTGVSKGDLDLGKVGTYLYDFVAFSSGVLVLGEFKPAPDGVNIGPVNAGYFTGPGQPQWVTSVDGYGNMSDGPRAGVFGNDESDGLIIVSAGGQYVFDTKTGTAITRDGYRFAGQVFPPRTLCYSYTPVEPHQVKIPNGDPVYIGTCDSEKEWMVPFSGPHPDISLVSGPNGTTARKATGTTALFTSLWSSPNPNSGQAWPFINAAAWDGTDTVYALSPSAPLGSQVWAFSLATGSIIWRAGYPPGSKPGDVSHATITLVGGVLAIDDPARTTMYFLDARNGEPVASLNNMNFAYIYTSGDVLAGYPDGKFEVSVLQPADSTNRSSSMQAPSDMPSCPAGMSPVSWTKFDTGSILVCKGNKYQVIVDDSDHPKIVPIKLEFTPSGMTITGKDGTVYRCGAGGSVVIVDAKGKSTTHPASMAWTPGMGRVTYQAPPTGIQPCPAGTWPISLSTWNGGWLLICGVDDNNPTWLGFSDGTRSATSTTVTPTTTGGYCADTNIGRICVNAAPALVTVTSPSGDVTQYPVTNNFFPKVGAGGGGEGTGAYGVPPPDATAADEARYLEQILIASAQTRSNLAVVLDHLEAKQCSAQDLAVLQSVVASRQQQIDAVNGAPVTHLPNGPDLVAKLRSALEVSLQADKLYVQWGQAIQAQDWATVDALAPQWGPPAHQSDELKKVFVDMWNSQIAPTYGVSTFSYDEI